MRAGGWVSIIGCMGLRVLIVDDHAAFGSWARSLLAAAGLRVVGEAGTGAAAMIAGRALRPDDVVLDVRLPDIDGFTVCRRLTEIGIRVVLCSVRDYGERIAGSGAVGFVPKERLSAVELRRVLGDG